MSAELQNQAMQEMNCIFIHSTVDDAGLSPNEFRVYGHIARRASKGDGWPGINSMATVCRIHPDTVRKCIKALLARRMISRRLRPGFTPLYAITKPSTWIHPPETKGGVKSSYPSESEGGESPDQNIGDPLETKGGEGYPLKVIQKENPSSWKKIEARTLKTPTRPSPNSAAPLPQLPNEIAVALADDWQRWQQHLRDKRRPMTATQAEEQIALLWEMTFEESRAAIKAAIRGGHTAFLFPKKANADRTEPAGVTL